MLFLAVAVLVAAVGDGSERHAGVYIGFWCAAGVIVFLPLKPVVGEAAIKRRTIDSEPVFEVTLPPGRAIRRALAALCITAGCVGMAIEPDTLTSARWGAGPIRVVGIVGTLLFGYTTLRHLVKRRAAQLLLTRDRVTATFGISTLSARWDDIAVVEEFEWDTAPGRSGGTVTQLGFDVPRDRIERSWLDRLMPLRPGGYGITSR